MGQILSYLDEDEPVDSADEASAVVGDFRRQALDAKRVATLTWPEFVDSVNSLNERCKKMIDEQGKHLVFAVRKGSTETYLWKATVQICCMKFNTITNKPESYKCMSLPKFLRVYSSLIGLINELPSEDWERAEDALASSSNTAAGHLGNRRDFNASMIMERVDALDSIVIGGRQDSCQSECIICMERRSDVVLPCSHAYCLPCIEQWNVNNHDCPTCRADIGSTDEAWVISDYPDKREFTDYLMKLSE